MVNKMKTLSGEREGAEKGIRTLFEESLNLTFEYSVCIINIIGNGRWLGENQKSSKEQI